MDELRGQIVIVAANKGGADTIFVGTFLGVVAGHYALGNACMIRSYREKSVAALAGHPGLTTLDSTGVPGGRVYMPIQAAVCLVVCDREKWAPVLSQLYPGEGGQ